MPKKRAKKGGGLDKKWVLLLGRVLIAVLFLATGWQKLSGLAAAAETLKKTNVPLASEWLAGVLGVIAVVAGLAILVGWYTRASAIVMAVYFALVTWFVHLAPAWKMTAGDGRSAEIMNVLLGLALLGSMLLLTVTGPGRISRDKR